MEFVSIICLSGMCSLQKIYGSEYIVEVQRYNVYLLNRYIFDITSNLNSQIQKTPVIMYLNHKLKTT